jgi:hypothetical protein
VEGGYTGLFDQRRAQEETRRASPAAAAASFAGQMLLHIDGSKHCWFQDDRYYD